MPLRQALSVTLISLLLLLIIIKKTSLQSLLFVLLVLQLLLVVYETAETSIIDAPVEDNYYPFVQVPDYSPSSQFDLDDFNLNYFDNTTNVNPQKAFQDAFENPSETESSSSVSNMGYVTVNEPGDHVWNIPKFNTEEKTAPKITSGLAKAVNAVLTIKSDKDAISKIGKQYLIPENVNFLCAPKCNKEIWH